MYLFLYCVLCFSCNYFSGTRSKGFAAIMKKQHLSSFVVGQGTKVPCIFMCLRDKLSNKLLWLFYLFVILPMKLHFLVF